MALCQNRLGHIGSPGGAFPPNDSAGRSQAQVLYQSNCCQARFCINNQAQQWAVDPQIRLAAENVVNLHVNQRAPSVSTAMLIHNTSIQSYLLSLLSKF